MTLTASEEGGAPAAAWGDTFFFYDPEGNLPENQRLPFTTVVIHDYAGWDTESNLDRDGIFRVNIAIGRNGFERLLGYPPATQAAHRDEFDYGATDVLLPHPLYASQGWVSILNPGDQTSARLRDSSRRRMAWRRAVTPGGRASKVMHRYYRTGITASIRRSDD